MHYGVKCKGFLKEYKHILVNFFPTLTPIPEAAPPYTARLSRPTNHSLLMDPVQTLKNTVLPDTVRKISKYQAKTMKCSHPISLFANKLNVFVDSNIKDYHIVPYFCIYFKSTRASWKKS